MFKHILIPVDFSAQTRDSLIIAKPIVDIGKGRVTLLHVIEMIADTRRDGELGGFYTKLEEQAKTKFESLLAEGCLENLSVTTEIIFGERVHEILDYADQHEVDLIVMASRKVDRVNPMGGLGTISQRIGILAQCPVLLVK
ncbi:MAG: universal stress protein [Caldilineaceae bacterium]|nr:universal stress protein [Caldilineaceae bacterium]